MPTGLLLRRISHEVVLHTHWMKLTSLGPVMLHGYTIQACAAQMGFEPEIPLFEQFRTAQLLF